ncbi:hypothetical protein [Streptomyces sp. UNOC14_S4]|uniref:hypothetical protein n=1 Tax=Streptomyces sp. UNOC14_S4 TaxID=2872340 RepID=UPI001E40C1B3|nr:hypothetical protein [Streptomyces sp. UNOC14_S4]MCC3766471.1 hypothetical protein [Streptomyces sp. UNOC14_S4]
MNDVKSQLSRVDWPSDVAQVVVNMIGYTETLSTQYGYDSPVPRDAAMSLLRGLRSLLVWGGRLVPDGYNSLGIAGVTGRMTYGVLPHYLRVPEGVPLNLYRSLDGELEQPLRPVTWSFHS